MRRCGNIIKFYTYEEAVAVGLSRPKSTGKGDKPTYIYDEIKDEWLHVDKETGEIGASEVLDKKLESRRRSTHRARNELIDLINTNFTSGDKFVTLTFADNLTDITKAKRYINQFFKKLRSYVEEQKKGVDLKYAYVIEFQERGAVHFHLIMNTLFIRNKTLEKLWSHGFVRINRIEHVRNVGAYVVKYMTKSGVDERLIGKKLYQTSQNCEKPQWIYGEEAERILHKLEVEGKKESYTNSFDTDRNGTATFKEFNLSD